MAPLVLLLEHESYLPNVNKVIKKIMQTTDPYTTILRNRLQKKLGAIIGENQSVTIIRIE